MTAAYVFSDMLVLAKRSLLRVRRQPDLLVGYTVQPIMFVLLFLYVFGGAIQTPGLDYVDFLMPGIIVQSMIFGGFVTALGLSDDLKKGLIDRFRSLPMWGPAVVAGRILGDVGLNVLQLVIMFGVGILAGFRFSTSLGDVLLGLVLVLFLGYAFSWVFAFLGLTASSPGSSERLRLHDPLPGHVRLIGLRPGRVDAELVAALRREQSVHDHGGCGASALRRNAGRQRRVAGVRVGCWDHRGVRSAVDLALPPCRRTLSRLLE